MPRKQMLPEEKHVKINVSTPPELHKRLVDYIEYQMWKPNVSQVMTKALDEFLKSQGF